MTKDSGCDVTECIDTVEAKVQYARKVIARSDNIVCISGIGVVMECGALNLKNDKVFYDIEERYHRAPEEMMSSVFFNVRMEQFYDFYKRELLQCKIEPTETFDALRRLQNTGKLKACVTYNIYGLSQQMGLKNVYELDGNIRDNRCSRCGRKFSLDYVKESIGVPLCDDCHTFIRPGIRLRGEQVRNDLMTKAVNACARAEVLLVLGTNLYDSMVRFAVNHYHGNNLILITKGEHFTDKAADLVIYDQVKDILPAIVP